MNDFIATLEHNYADDNTMYYSGKDKDSIKLLLGQDYQTVTKWFY